jgi:hypothetical protein
VELSATVENVHKIEGFVALIDVLGFRALVARDYDLTEVHQYVKIVESILDNASDVSELQFVLFSDNLVVNTRDATPESFKKLIIACSNLSFELAQKQIAVRGAIAYGQFMRSPTTRKGVILAGQPIVEADYYQHAQDWIGTILAPSVVRHEEHLEEHCIISPPKSDETLEDWTRRVALAIHLQHWSQIPFRTTSPFANKYFDGYVIVPICTPALSPESLKTSLNTMRHQLETMKAVAPDPASQEKYSLTLNWLWGVQSDWGNRRMW